MLFVCCQAFANFLPKDSFESESFRIYYPVNKADIHAEYMGNDSTLKHILRYLKSSLEIKHITIYSYTSPEGTPVMNARLAHERAVTAKKYLLEHVPEGRVLSDSVFSLMPESENWEGLRMEVMESYHRHDRDSVISILEDPTITASRKKELLQGLDGGRSWRWMIDNLMPLLRYATWITVWRPIPEIPEMVEEPVEKVAKVEPQEPEKADLCHNSQVLDTVLIEPLREPLLSVKTNLLYDLFTMPDFGFAPILNVKVEFYPRNSRWTVVGEYDFPWWKHDSRHDYFQILNWKMETRRYFRHDGTHTGHYLSAYLMGGYYDIGLDKERGWQGEGASVGLGYGYAMPIGRKQLCKLDFHVQLGYYYGRYDPYHAGEPYNGKYYYDWDRGINLFKRRNHKINYLGPTGAGVTLSYDLLWRKSDRKSATEDRTRP